MFTLPRGPTETTQSWFAGSRLGCYCCTILVWGSGFEDSGPECHYFMSRIKEKGSSYSMRVYQEMLSLLSFKNAHTFSIWSDGGKHFKSRQSISTVTLRGMAKLCEESELKSLLPEVHVSYGVPSHFKNPADGMQGQLRHCLEEIAKSTQLDTIGAFVAEATALWQSYRDDPSAAPRMKATFHEFWPNIEKSTFEKNHCD